MFIKAIASTYLKKKVLQASDLTKEQKMTVSLGKEYKIRSFSEAEDGHYLVDLDYDAGTWYLWSGHWQLPWEDNREKLEVVTVLGNNILNLPKITTIPQTWREINWQDFDAKVSKYFSIREITNGDARRFPQADDIKQNIFTLARELDRVREAWNSPIIVTSWYRPPAINRAIGGASKSQHLSGKAVDVRPVRGNLRDFQHWLDTVTWTDKALGYGAAKGFVHLDLRPGRIRWNY